MTSVFGNGIDLAHRIAQFHCFRHWPYLVGKKVGLHGSFASEVDVNCFYCEEALYQKKVCTMLISMCIAIS